MNTIWPSNTVGSGVLSRCSLSNSLRLPNVARAENVDGQFFTLQFAPATADGTFESNGHKEIVMIELGRVSEETKGIPTAPRNDDPGSEPGFVKKL